MATPPSNKARDKKYRVFCAKCGRNRVVEGGAVARDIVRTHNRAKHHGYPVAAYESEK